MNYIVRIVRELFLGPSREELINSKINGLPLPTTVFPGYYHMESLFLENKAVMLEYCNHISTIGGFLLEIFEIPYVSSALDFLISHFSVESALLAMDIEKNVIGHLNTFIKAKLQTIKSKLQSLQATDLSDNDRTSYVNIGITGCEEIAYLFSDQESYLFKNPLASAPMLINLVPVYIGLSLMKYAATESESVRVGLLNQVHTFKSTVESHMDRSVTERLKHIRLEICSVPGDGCCEVYCDYIFPKKLKLCSVWYPGESIIYLERLSRNDIDEKVLPVYKNIVRELYSSYLETSVSIINAALENFQRINE